MRIDDFLAAVENLPLIGIDAFAPRSIVVIAPHPDDESLGCGGLIAAACGRGIPVRLVVLSDGTGSHPNSRLYPRQRLRALREAETIAAAGSLGLAAEAVSFLRLPDRFVPRIGAEAEAAAARIAELAAADDASDMFVTWKHDPHCDHEAAFAIAAMAQARTTGIRLHAYLVWGWSLPSDTEIGDPALGFRLDVTEHLPAKRRAIGAHRSQISDLIDDDPQGFRLDAAMIARHERPVEIYLDAP